MRKVVLAAFLLASSISGAQSISLEASARPLQEVLAEIGKQTGTLLLAEEGLRTEPVILRVRDMSLPQLKTELTQLFQAEWRDEGGVTRLVRAWPVLPPTPKKGPETVPEVFTVKLDPTEQETMLAEFVRRRRGGEQLSPLESEEARKILFHPDRYEPLAVLLGDRLIRAADKTGTNLIAYVDDSILQRAALSLAEDDLTSVYENLKPNYSIQSSESLVTIRPQDREVVLKFRADRRAFARFLGEMESGAWTWRTAAEMAYKNHDLFHLTRIYTDSPLETGDQLPLRVLGSLTAQEIARASRPEGVSLSQLGEETRHLIDRHNRDVGAGGDWAPPRISNMARLFMRVNPVYEVILAADPERPLDMRMLAERLVGRDPREIVIRELRQRDEVVINVVDGEHSLLIMVKDSARVLGRDLTPVDMPVRARAAHYEESRRLSSIGRELVSPQTGIGGRVGPGGRLGSGG